MSDRLLDTGPGAANVIGESEPGDLRLRPLSVTEYHRMMDEGILPEDTATELLDGIVVGKDRGDPGGDPMTVGEAHAYVVRQLAHLGRRLDPTRLHLQTQQPVVIPDHGEPEPDAAVVLRPVTAPAKPAAGNVSCVIEVAGTSLHRDRTTKLRHYARGRIGQYVILNLAERTAEEHCEPDPASGTYGSRTVHSGDARLELALGGGESLEVELDELFPPT